MNSLKNGMAFKRSHYLKTWEDWGDFITLGQANWPRAKGRIMAGTVMDLRNIPAYGKYLMLFHGSGPLTEEAGDFDKNASICIAWSDNLQRGNWPEK